MLRSPAANMKRKGAKIVFRDYMHRPEVLDIVEEELRNGYHKSDQSSSYADAMAWFCRILGESGDIKYRPLLEKVAENADRWKTRRHAKKSLKNLSS